MNNDSLRRWIDNVRASSHEWGRRVDDEFGAGAWGALDRSLLALFLHPSRGKKREQDLDVLARGLVRRWKPQPAALAMLRKRADENGRRPEEEKVELAKVGLLWAAEEERHPQRFRVPSKDWLPTERQDGWRVDERGVAWVTATRRGGPTEVVSLVRGRFPKGENGRIIRVEPWALPLSVRFAWFVTASKRAGKLALADEGWVADAAATRAGEDMLAPDRAGYRAALEDVLLGVCEENTPMEDVLLRREVEAIRNLANLSPQEQEFLDAFLELGEWRDAGKHLGWNPDRTRKTKQRLIPKLKTAVGGTARD